MSWSVVVFLANAIKTCILVISGFKVPQHFSDVVILRTSLTMEIGNFVIELLLMIELLLVI